jgi:hypothetical protein
MKQISDSEQSDIGIHNRQVWCDNYLSFSYRFPCRCPSLKSSTEP